MVILAIKKGERTLEHVELCWNHAIVHRVIPPRDPDHKHRNVSAWFIEPSKRRAMGAHIVQVAEDGNCSGRGSVEEEHAAFWGLVGAGKRWIGEDVDWWLVYSPNAVEKEDIDAIQWTKTC